MKTSIATLGLLASAWAGCAGTIDDASSFEGYAAVVSRAAPDAGEDTPQSESVDAAVQDQAADAAAPTASEPSPAASEPSPAASSCDFKAVMQQRCGAAACHGGPSSSSGLDLTSDKLAARLDSEVGPGACATKPMLDRDAPEQSALYLVVAGDSCGVRMPLGGTLDAAEQACVLQWIAGL